MPDGISHIYVSWITSWCITKDVILGTCPTKNLLIRLPEVSSKKCKIVDAEQGPLGTSRSNRAKSGCLENSGNKGEAEFLSEKAKEYVKRIEGPQTNVCGQAESALQRV